MIITRNNLRFEVEPLKFCKLHNSMRIYLFRVLKQQVIEGPYIVAARLGDDTLHFMHFICIENAVSYYLQLICQYA